MYPKLLVGVAGTKSACRFLIMPSLDHEALALLFRVRPTLAAELVRDVLGVSLPAHSAARLDHADFTQITPT
ncbi:MAG: hypothetical protein V2A73_07770 [Pseudomonadota bacterium]